MDELTTEVLATPTDLGQLADSNYTFNDMYMLMFAFFLFVVGVVSKNLFRKMYINLIGGRKGE